jgi:hypothetical protein
MTPPDVEDQEKSELPLPRRDWVILPLLVVVTVVLIAGSTELIARRMFTRSETSIYDCLVLNDPSTGTRGKPGCSCWEKIEENQPVEYRFNQDGYRADSDFNAKSPDIYRIVMVGSSFAMGYRVQLEKSFGELLAKDLSSRRGARVELYNQAMAGSGGSPRSVSLRFNDALAANPDMILWVLTFWDVSHVSTIMPANEARVDNGARGKTKQLIREALNVNSISEMLQNLSEILISRLRSHWESTRSCFLFRHFLAESQSQYLHSYLSGADSTMGFMRSEPSAGWQSWLGQTDGYAAELASRTAAAKVPLVMVLVPDRAQAALVARGSWPEGVDPYKLDSELHAIALSHGISYLDILPAFRDVPSPERLYLPVDGHPTEEGHRAIAGLLSKGLSAGPLPSLNARGSPPSGGAR